MCYECNQNPCHPRCPNAEPSIFNYACYKCGEGIFTGEEYITNNNGQYAHFECVDYARDLMVFLGYDIKKMEDDDY